MITKVMKEEVYLTTKLRHAILIGVETTQRAHTVSPPRLNFLLSVPITARLILRSTDQSDCVIDWSLFA